MHAKNALLLQLAQNAQQKLTYTMVNAFLLAPIILTSSIPPIKKINVFNVSALTQTVNSAYLTLVLEMDNAHHVAIHSCGLGVHVLSAKMDTIMILPPNNVFSARPPV